VVLVYRSRRVLYWLAQCVFGTDRHQSVALGKRRRGLPPLGTGRPIELWRNRPCYTLPRSAGSLGTYANTGVNYTVPGTAYGSVLYSADKPVSPLAAHRRRKPSVSPRNTLPAAWQHTAVSP
jgi:hypothetical protein